MQDIIDVWLKVQAAWLYLEPIFSSEDIMAQMPEEGRRFRTVDGTWKKCMKCTAEDPLVLNATGQPGLLENLRKSLELLELIQKGRVQKIQNIRLVWTPDYLGAFTSAWIGEIMTVNLGNMTINLGHMTVNLGLLIPAAYS